MPTSRLLRWVNAAAGSTADPRPVLQPEPCPPLFSTAVCCVQAQGEHSLLHLCSAQQSHKAQGLYIWAMLHIESVGPCWAPRGCSVPPIKGKALLQPFFLVPQTWGGEGLGLASCSEKHESPPVSGSAGAWLCCQAERGRAGAGVALRDR